MTFAVSKKKMLEVKAASTVKRYSKTLIALHQERDIDLSFLTARVNRIARGLTKMRVDLWGVRKKAKKSPISPAMLLRLGELALEHSAELGPVTRRANFLAWEYHFRGGTVTVAAEVVRNGWWNPHWHLTRGNIVFHNRADSPIIPHCCRSCVSPTAKRLLHHLRSSAGERGPFGRRMDPRSSDTHPNFQRRR